MKHLSAFCAAQIERLEARRMLSAGQLDPTFGKGGTVQYSYTYDQAKGRDVAMQGDGEIVELLGVPNHGMSVRRLNTDGSLDKTFGDHGTAVVSKQDPEFGSGDIGAGIVVQPDDKIVVAGKSNGGFLLARLLVNGALDTSFNRTGYTGVFASFSSPTTLLRQPDGKLLLAGTAYHKLAIARFSANGVIESAFGKFGRTTIDLPATPSESITALSLQSDGKILAATDAGSIVRFSAAGKLDATFGRNGVLAERAPKDVSFNSTAIIQPNVKIVVGGERFLSSGEVHGVVLRFLPDGNPDNSFGKRGVVDLGYGVFASRGILASKAGDLVFALSDPSVGVVRITSSGLIDKTFGKHGMALFQPLPGNDIIRSLKFQGDGKLLIVGDGGIADQPFVVRLSSSGALDSSFGHSGIVSNDPTGRVGQYKALAIQADGKIIAVGTTTSASTGSSALLVDRYNSDGRLDISFGDHGRFVADFAGESDYAWSAALAGDKIVVTGQDKDAAIVLIRLNANGTLDKSFNGTGRVVDPVGRQMGFLSQVAQKDGSIVVAGDQFPGVLVARYTAAGKLDKSFGTNGHVTFGWNDHYGYDNGLPKKILLMPDGRLIIAGDTNAPNGPGEFGALHYDYALARLLPNGSLDPSFGDHGKALFRIKGTFSLLHDAALLKDGRIVLVGDRETSDNGQGILVSSSGTRLATYPAPTGLQAVTVAPDGKFVILGNGESYVMGSSFKFMTRFTVPAFVTTVAVQKDGKFLFAGDAEPGDLFSTSFPLLQRHLGEASG